eukprot:1947868-Alexandrium_andersonii.AAC.1
MPKADQCLGNEGCMPGALNCQAGPHPQRHTKALSGQPPDGHHTMGVDALPSNLVRREAAHQFALSKSSRL